MFNCKIKLLKARPGERYASSLTNMSLNNKIIKKYGKIHLKDYLTSFIKG
jgi:UDP-glucose 4-epimerase